ITILNWIILIWSDDRFAILDFDDCSNNWFVADIAYALRDLFDDNIDMDNPHFKEFMVGYTKETEVDTVLLHQMQWFMRMHNLVSFTKLLR
ncbi:hypothetical protein JQK62_25855, partial [Leptospira santarosai]|nr:hypothetical protein [Leptospira santarosai]